MALFRYAYLNLPPVREVFLLAIALALFSARQILNVIQILFIGRSVIQTIQLGLEII